MSLASNVRTIDGGSGLFQRCCSGSRGYRPFRLPCCVRDGTGSRRDGAKRHGRKLQGTNKQSGSLLISFGLGEAPDWSLTIVWRGCGASGCRCTSRGEITQGDEDQARRLVPEKLRTHSVHWSLFRIGKKVNLRVSPPDVRRLFRARYRTWR